MKITNTAFLISALTCFANAGTLEENFKTPPREAKPQTWWHWFGGHVTKEGISKDLEAMSRVGIGGIQNFHVNLDTPQGSLAYDSPEWHELIAYAISEAARLNIEYGFHNCAGWSSSGGTWIMPEHAMKQVVWMEQQVDVGASSGNMQLRMETPLQNKGFYCDIAVVAFPILGCEEENQSPWLIDNWQNKSFKYPHAQMTITPSRLNRDERIAPANAIINGAEIVDVTRFASGDELSIPASVLAGHARWTVIRFGYTATNAQNGPAAGDGSGLECDKMSTQALDIHWDHLITSIQKDAGKNKAIFTNILIDSFEQNYQNWTRGFESEFHTRRTYEIIRWLPALTGRVINSVDQTERFLWDFRRTCAELINQNYFGHLAKRAHADGLYLAIEPYGMGNFDEMGAALLADMPMGEFWAHSYDERTPRLASSAGHIMGRKFIGAEAFTAHGVETWTAHPENLKARGDYFFAKGINRFIYHTYVHQPWEDAIKPGMNMARFGFNFNRNNTWFEQSKPYLTYMARAQSMLQAGQAAKDILYVYGECIPTDSQPDAHISPRAPTGYDFDKAGYQVLKMADVKDGKITFPSGMQYRLLALTHAERTTPSFLKEVKRLVDLGATVVAERPVSAPGLADYPASDAQVAQYIEQLWDSGRVQPHSALAEVLAGLKLGPDFSAEPSAGIEYIHRRNENAEWYFVANIDPWRKDLASTFRVTGKMPEIWNPETGETQPAPVWQQNTDGKTTVQLSLAANQSLFVVFRETLPASYNGIVSTEFKKRSAATDPDQSNVILSATYGVLDDPSKQVDVTQRLLDAINEGRPIVRVSNQLCDGRDPAFETVKSLCVKGRVDGKDVVLSTTEGRSMDLSTFSFAGAGVPSVRYVSAHQAAIVDPGTLDVTYSDGSTRQITSKGARITRLSNPWKVQFGEFGPQEAVTFPALTPWNEHADEKIKYFSGTAVYRTFFTYKKPKDTQAVLLDLGRVYNLATVFLNGKELGTFWKAPFLIDVQDALVDGHNRIEIRVTNLQANRVIGDEQYPEIKTVRRIGGIDGELESIPEWVVRGEKNPDKGRHLFFTFKFFNRDSPLFDSGLVGDIRIIEPDVVSIPPAK